MDHHDTHDERERNRVAFRRLAALVAASGRIVALTGAGISTESGIPDYRGPNGVWAQRRIPRAEDVRTDPEAQARYWRERRLRFPEMLARQPNAGHRALARLAQAGRLRAVITQNIDGLHQKSGVPDDRVIELHGSTRKLRCIPNGHHVNGDDVQKQLEAGELDPRCPQCGGVLRSDTVLFGETLPKDALEMAARLSAVADVMVVVGSSLVVYPAAQLPQIAKERGASLIIIDRAETALDDLADIVIRGEAGAILTEIANGVLESS